MAYLSFEGKDETKAFEIMNEIDELKKLHLSVKYYSSENNSQKLKKSNIVVFFLNNEYLNSKKFKKEWNLTKTLGKVHIFVIIDTINVNNYVDLGNSFGVIDLTINESQSEMLKRFQSFFLRHLLIEKDYFGLSLDSYNIRLMSVKKIESDLKKTKFRSSDEEFKEFRFISPDELILTYCDDSKFVLVLMNTINTSIIGKIEREDDFFYTWIENLEQIFVVKTRFYHETPSGFFYDKKGELLKIRNFKFGWKDLIYSVTYDLHGHFIYLLCNFICSEHNGITILKYDQYLNLVSTFNCSSYLNKIKIYDLYCYMYYYGGDELKIFDLSFNIVISMSVSFPIKNLIAEQNHENIVFIQTTESVLLLNILNYNIIGNIKNPFELLAIFNDTIIFNDGIENFFYYKIDFSKKKKFQDSFSRKFICNCWGLKSHILKNACLLPCGNSISLNCLYDNYNIQKKSIKCRLCREIYKLPSTIEMDTKVNDLIAENSSKILNEMIGNGYKITDKRGN